MVAPVWRVTPVAAFLCETENVQNQSALPGPFFQSRSDAVDSSVDSRAAVALADVAATEIRSMRSALFIFSPGRSIRPQRVQGGNNGHSLSGNLAALFSYREENVNCGNPRGCRFWVAAAESGQSPAKKRGHIPRRDAREGVLRPQE